MEVARVISNHKRYILNLEESNILNVFAEYKTVKKDIRCMGFCPECYKKIITMKKQIDKIILPKITEEANLKHIKEFSYEIKKVGYARADRNILVNRKEILFKDCNNPKEYVEKLSIPSEERDLIREFVFRYRESGDKFQDIATLVNIEYGLPISDVTARRLYREACKEKGLEPLKRKGVR